MNTQAKVPANSAIKARGDMSASLSQLGKWVNREMVELRGGDYLFAFAFAFVAWSSTYSSAIVRACVTRRSQFCWT